METIKIKLSDKALKAIAIVAICLTALGATFMFVNSRIDDRKVEVINNCFNVATYTAKNEETKSEVKEPILRFFKTCMSINGYGSNYTFLSE
jgi:hypothetical protein